MRLLLTLAVLGLLAIVPAPTPAGATPGMLDGKSCHGRNGPQGYHCHPRSKAKVNKRGRFYMPGGG